MRRRDFIICLVGAAGGWPSTVRAQQNAMPVIGYLGISSPGPLSAPQVAAFHQGLSETGYVDGQNVFIEYRWAEGSYDRLPALVADLVGRKVDLIVTGGFPAILAAKNATSTIPIVFASGADPVAPGLVAGLARPGGNLTGVCSLAVDHSQIKSRQIGPSRPAPADLLDQIVPPQSVV